MSHDGASRPSGQLIAWRPSGQLAVPALALSVLLNLCLAWRLSVSHDPTPRRLTEPDLCAGDVHGRMRDCASVSCPRYFVPSPAVVVGSSRMVPMQADTRYRLHGPRDMLELTRLLYGATAELGEPYKRFSNPYGRVPNLNYQWTQINERKLEQVWGLLPNGGRKASLFVEVGSFVGRSSVLIGNWLRKREAQEAQRVSLLCIDTWLGDLVMTLNKVFPEEMGKRNGHSTLYHLWLLNIISANLTERVLPLVAPSLLGARVLVRY